MNATDKNIKQAIEEGYNLAEKKEELKKIGEPNYFFSGNEGISVGGLSAGMDIYIAYPMTPASTVLHFLAKRQVENQGSPTTSVDNKF